MEKSGEPNCADAGDIPVGLGMLDLFVFKLLFDSTVNTKQCKACSRTIGPSSSKSRDRVHQSDFRL